MLDYKRKFYNSILFSFIVFPIFQKYYLLLILGQLNYNIKIKVLKYRYEKRLKIVGKENVIKLLLYIYIYKDLELTQCERQFPTFRLNNWR